MEGELRIDDADGRAYPLKDWCVQYGGTAENPPEQWKKARAAPSTWAGEPGREKQVAIDMTGGAPGMKQQPTGFTAHLMTSSAPVGSAQVEAFIQENQLEDKAAGLLREQKPDVQGKMIAAGPMLNCRYPMATMASRLRRAVGSENDDMPWNPNGCGKRSGIVKMWHSKKGYGFITDAADGGEYFCHHIDIGGRSLVKDGTVTYDLGMNTNGAPKAINITGAVGPRMGGDGGPPPRGAGGGPGGMGGVPMIGMGDIGMGMGSPYGGGMPATAAGKGAGVGGAALIGGFGASGNPQAVPLGGGGGAFDTLIEHWVHVPPQWTVGSNVRFSINGVTYEVPVPPGQPPGSQFMINL